MRGTGRRSLATPIPTDCGASFFLEFIQKEYRSAIPAPQSGTIITFLVYIAADIVKVTTATLAADNP